MTEDLSQVKPISIDGYSDLTRELLKPLLEALERGDIELATALAPSNLRLCGYHVISKALSLYGGGTHTADLWVLSIPPGVYPIFAKLSSCEEANIQNSRKRHYDSILCWYDGRVMYEVGSTRVELSIPYGDILARDARFSNAQEQHGEFLNRTFLVYPFEVRELSITYADETIITYGIIDSILQEYIP